MRQFDRSTAIWFTGRLGSVPTPTRCQLGSSEVTAFGLTWIQPSSVPAYTPSPPSATPIVEMKQPRAPFGAAPGQPLVRSPLTGCHVTSPALAASALSVR
jgi:hypothetical protein